ncbi:MAG: ribonuclease P protein component [Luteimonas sp.]
MTAPGARFPREARVRARGEFDAVFKQARRTSDPLLSLHWLVSGTPARLGLAVSRKVDPHAVGRNRIKRILREQFRALRAQLASGDYVCVARAPAAKADAPALRAAFVGVLQRAGALPPSITGGTMRDAFVSDISPSHTSKPASDAG